MSVKTNELPAQLRRYAHFIDSVSDERGSGDGYWVYLKNGYICETSETHQVHEDSPAECAKVMKSDIEACYCRDCRS